MSSHRFPGLSLMLFLLLVLRVSSASCQGRQSGAWTLFGSDAEWRLAGGDYGQRRFSGLKEVTPANVPDMKPVWSFSTGTLRADGGSPLIVDGKMYVKSAFPSIIYALDIEKQGDPFLWKYVPPGSAESSECCWSASHALALHASGRLITLLPDGVLVGLDAERGTEAWRAKLAAPESGRERGRGTFAGPFVVRDFVIGATFREGGDAQTCGRVTAWEGYSGKRVWEARCEDGVEGGRSGTMAYDPDLNLLYYAWGTLERQQGGSGGGTWSVQVIARRLETGEPVWSTEIREVEAGRDLALGGVVLLESGGKKLLAYIDASGVPATLDRVNGKLLVSRPGESPGDQCATAADGKNPSAASYSPVTGLIYFARTSGCRRPADARGLLKPASWSKGGDGSSVEAVTRLAAWDPVRGEAKWEIEDRVSGGVLSTATGLVFYGTADGWVKCVDQKTGKSLWRFKTPSGVVGDPVTFGGSNKRQYLAVITGIGGWQGIEMGWESYRTYSGFSVTPASFPHSGGVLTVFALSASEGVAATGDSDTIPQFPWPPPQVTDRTRLPRGLVVSETSDTLGRVFERIVAAYRRAQISWSVYAVGTDGIAVVGRQENITDNGSPDDPRWGSDPPPPRGIGGYLAGLFKARPGRYRIVALIVRHQSMVPDPKLPTRQQMDSLVVGGALSLPDWLAAKVIEGRCEALIYEFFRRSEDAKPEIVSNTAIGAVRHLIGAGLWTRGEMAR